jgi:hypothetical protein
MKRSVRAALTELGKYLTGKGATAEYLHPAGRMLCRSGWPEVMPRRATGVAVAGAGDRGI